MFLSGVTLQLWSHRLLHLHSIEIAFYYHVLQIHISNEVFITRTQVHTSPDHDPGHKSSTMCSVTGDSSINSTYLPVIARPNRSSCKDLVSNQGIFTNRWDLGLLHSPRYSCLLKGQVQRRQVSMPGSGVNGGHRSRTRRSA